MANIVGKWEGGTIVRSASGKNTFYIRKTIRGVPYDVSTRASTVAAALKQLVRFQASPETYEPSGALPGKPVTILGKLDAYADWCRSKKRPNSPNWIYQKRRYLNLWAEVLPGDARRWTEDLILDAMKAKSVPHNRLASLKAFCTWLRKVDRSISRAEEVTADMPIEAVAPAKWSKPRAITREAYEATLEKIDVSYRDIMVVQAACGLHTTEVHRLSHGKGEINGVTLTIFHKSGDQHAMEVSPETAAAAAKVIRRGGFSMRRYEDAIADACVASGVTHWAPGCLRHSAASWMAADGISLDVVATYLNHDLATLKKHYLTAVIPMPKRAV